MPGISKKPSFNNSPHSSPQKKTVRLAENPHVSAFLSPKSRIFTGGHGYPGVPPTRNGPATSANPGAFSTASAAPDAFSISGKQLTPEEVAQKIASMLKPGPPFFSRVSNADLIDFISDSSIMNCDKLRAQASALQEKKAASRAKASFVPSGTVVRRRAEEESWTGVGTVWSSLDALPAGAAWSKIPGASATSSGSTLSAKSGNGLEDDGLWNAITFSVDIDCTTVELAKSVVIPTEVLQKNNFFNGNAQTLFDDIGAGVKYKWDNLVSKTSGGLRNKASSSALGGSSTTSGYKIMPNYLSLSAYTDPNSTAFSTSSFELKWPSWMPWGKKHTTPSNTSDSTASNDTHAGGQKRVWIPSTTKVSIHASWWGYNLYLPQSVLDSLDGDVEEAEKIANLINKCLTYVLNNVPAGLPASFAAVITVLKAIAPTTGYISTFIGWSWDQIKSFNKGQGTAPSAGTGTQMTAQDTTSTTSPTSSTEVAAPGATLPPSNPSSVNVDLSAPAANDTSNAQYPIVDQRGRGGDATTSAPMGSTLAPTDQTPIDAES
uniref:Uncharacterized protein n=1 Tax=Melanopsichium pennsylvanicum 4 TaxID=1398559 RepID=A0A077R6D4_9BASI|nr:putative protein [Melanopsichium pennsylvanicum 4]